MAPLLDKIAREQPDMEVVAEAAGGREGIEQFLKYLPDVTLH